MTARILLSYWYCKTTDLDELAGRYPEPPEVFADSGAFSAYWGGARITVDEYAAWLERWSHRIHVAANLDVIGDPAGTLDNQARLEAAGHHPIPVFHVGEPFDYLAGYCDRYPYVALGGMVGFKASGTLVKRWAVQCFLAGRASGTLFHGFGQTRMDTLKSLPWYSFDSTTWNNASRFGEIQLWDPDRARIVKSLHIGDHRGIYRHADLIRAHGGDPALFAAPRAQGTPERLLAAQEVSVRAWLRFEAWLRDRHALDWNGQVGPRLYFVDTTVLPDLMHRVTVPV